MADAANALISKVHTLACTHTHVPKVGYPLSSVRVFPIIKQSPNTELDTPPLESIESNRPNPIELNRNGELGSSLGKLPARGTLHFTRISPAGVSRCPLTIGGHTLCFFFFFSLATSVQINLCPANVWTISVSVSVSVSGPLCAIDGPIIKPEPRENARRTHGKLMENSWKTHGKRNVPLSLQTGCLARLCGLFLWLCCHCKVNFLAYLNFKANDRRCCCAATNWIKFRLKCKWKKAW